MRIRLVLVGRTDAGPVSVLFDEFIGRLKHMVPVQVDVLELPRGRVPTEAQAQQVAEGKLLLDALKGSERVILLDEGGRQFPSIEFATFIQKCMNTGLRELTFVVGGAYGFSPEVRSAFQEKVALSAMTFTHQMVRPILAEQLYRALTIINNLKYHH
jgi:23S rRNA (pseudouridine1915-N3)-methyltransferase